MATRDDSESRGCGRIGTDIAYELESLADSLLAEAPRGFVAKNDSEYLLRIRVRSQGARLKQLSQALLTVLTESDDQSARQAAEAVYG